MDQGVDLAAELSESDSADRRLPGTGLPVSVAAAGRTLLAWLLWAPVIVCLNLVWRHTMQKQNEQSAVSELHCRASARVARRRT